MSTKTLGMKGSYEFTAGEVDRYIPQGAPGNYALGYRNARGRFVMQYVGRSDGDLRAELKLRLDPTNNPEGKRFRRFKYCLATGAREAYEKECRDYHIWDPPYNTNHPAAPRGMACRCPVEGCRYA